MQEDEMGGACSTHGKDEKCVQDFCLKTSRKRAVGRPSRRWEDNIKTDLKERGWKIAN
jgi:hypothetical protein